MCHVLNVDTQKAEEISLVENLQRNNMTAIDKIRSFSRLYNRYNENIDEVVGKVHMSKQTIDKYLKIQTLPTGILERLDKNDETKISVDVAVELTKINKEIDPMTVLNKIISLTSQQKIQAIRKFRLSESSDLSELESIKDDIALYDNNVKLAPAEPYVKDVETRQFVRIPTNMYTEIVNLIKLKLNGNIEYLGSY